MKIRTADRLGDVKEYYFSGKLREIAAMRKSGKDIINLGVGSPDLMPHPDVIKVLQQTVNHTDNHGYQSYKGVEELRHAISNWYLRHYRVQLDPDHEILPLIGSKEGIMHIAMTYLNPGDEVLVPDPGYPTYQSACRLTGAKVVSYSLNADRNWLPDLDALGKGDLTNTKMMWVNYPHMPSGARADKKFFRKLVAWARKHAILLCHDNPYAFILNPEPVSLLEIEGAKDVVIELNSLSKAYNMAGWRIGFMAAHRDRIADIMRFKTNMDSGMFKPVQQAASIALNLPDEWHDDLNQIYQRRRLAATDIFDTLGVSWDKEQSGLFLWGKIESDRYDDLQLSDTLLYQSGVFLTPGSVFGKNGSDYIRISLCNPVEKLNQACERIAAMLVNKQESAG